MPAWGEALVFVACIVGIIGTILPILPGHLLIGGAIAVWALIEHSWLSLGVAIAAIAVLIIGSVLTYLIPGKRMHEAGVPGTTLLIGSVAGIIGMFVVPVVGLPLFFILGVYLTEVIRLRSHHDATPSTIEAVKGAILSTAIGLTAAGLATTVWLTAAVLT
jgi:uncharacterized protein YqgC (DUF456 family)